jgi:glycosyltransferase involved in cell wall biosynthesis
MHIAFVDVDDPRNPEVYSGIPSRMLENMERITQVSVVAPLRTHAKYAFVAQKCSYGLINKKFFVDREPLVLRSFARQIEARVPKDAEVIFSWSSVPISLLNVRWPIFLWPDATLPAVRGYYPHLDNVCERTWRVGREQEIEALSRATVALYSSEWGAEMARQLVPENTYKVRALNYGANIDPELTDEQARRFIAGRRTDQCHMLFVGLEPKRKGLDTAIEITRLLNDRGLQSVLHVVGEHKVLRRSDAPPYVRIEGRLPRDSARMRELFLSCNLLTLPTRADCSPIALCEGAAHALPAVSRKTGGVPSITEDGRTGLLFDVDAPPEDYADRIATLLEDQASYRAMSWAAFETYRDRLNWRTQVGKLVEIMAETLDRRRRKMDDLISRQTSRSVAGA